jgi:hypothetical protein
VRDCPRRTRWRAARAPAREHGRARSSRAAAHPFPRTPRTPQVKLGRLVAGWSLVWLLESGIELAKEMACHPANVHEHLKALLPLSAAVGWTTALHLGLRHGKALVGRAQSAFASAAGKLNQPKQSPTPSSPTPTPEKAAAKAAAVAADADDADAADEAEAEDAADAAAVDEAE